MVAKVKKTNLLACGIPLWVAGAALALAQPGMPVEGDKPLAASEMYSSSALPEAPSSGMSGTAVLYQALPASGGVRPFSAVGLAVKVGIGGVGFDIATPLSQHLNLRGGGQFFNYSLSSSTDGINYTGTLDEKSGDLMLDYYPFHGGFRVSPGMILYNGVHVNAIANVPGGQTFTLDDTTYTSGNPGTGSDPIHGSADIQFGNKVAPAFTLGWGNMIPRRGSHWSIPFEIGFMYIDTPKFTLDLAGTACQQGQGCGSVQTDPDIQADLRDEVKEINDDLKPLRFYPIVSVGFSYSFGKR